MAVSSVGRRKLGEFSRRALSTFRDDNIESVSSSEGANSDTDFVPPEEKARTRRDAGAGAGDGREEEGGDGGSQGAQCFPSEDGGFVVDLESISNSPIKGFKRLSDLPQQEREAYLNQFSGRGKKRRKEGSGWDAGDGFDVLNKGEDMLWLYLVLVCQRVCGFRIYTQEASLATLARPMHTTTGRSGAVVAEGRGRRNERCRGSCCSTMHTLMVVKVK